jgi:hypothetical protein
MGDPLERLRARVDLLGTAAGGHAADVRRLPPGSGGGGQAEMKTPDAIQQRIAKLVALRDNTMQLKDARAELQRQANELLWVLGEMKEEPAGTLLPRDDPARPQELDALIDEQDIEDRVREIMDSIYSRALEAGSHQVTQYIIARVTRNLLDSMSLDLQTEVIKLRMFGREEK